MKSALLCLAIIYAASALGVLLMLLDRRNFVETEDDMSIAERSAIAAATGETPPPFDFSAPSVPAKLG